MEHVASRVCPGLSGVHLFFLSPLYPLRPSTSFNLSVSYGSFDIHSIQYVGIAGTMEQRPGRADFDAGLGLCWKGKVHH
jgi:hypothetical protein